MGVTSVSLGNLGSGHSYTRSPSVPTRDRKGGKEDLGAQPLGGLSVSGELLSVIVRDRMNLDAQGLQPLHHRAVRGLAVGRDCFEIVVNGLLPSTAHKRASANCTIP